MKIVLRKKSVLFLGDTDEEKELFVKFADMLKSSRCLEVKRFLPAHMIKKSDSILEIPIEKEDVSS
jgi:hypothetical protein